MENHLITHAFRSKLLTPEETAQYLGVTADEVHRLVEQGRLSAYRLGGQFVRFRREDVVTLAQGRHAARRAPSGAPGPRPAWPERIREFFYLHDFYLLAAALTLLLVVVLLRFA